MILIAGIGNVFLGDDGFGPEVARRLAAGPLPDGVRAADYGIRGLHLAHDVDGHDTLILVDALPPGTPGAIEVLEVDPADVGAGGFDGHAMDPLAVLAAVARLGGVLPRTYVVGCRVVTVGERIGLSAPVAAAVGEAVATVHALISTPARG
ncbi:peptidase M52 [Actinoplanes lobatus]|uniref:Hydrogenase maturation protease n=1 Tax=Actinoplanes lobatus TaxID=113568 RepID=A0A7W7HP86_9ACTN|nr:hydrogenase maturation protease [Actinoplanes lobatus]MBB4754145.1 hydrogenase maturation protease [Actinoplanes lobatus]GGN77096.1 peptidase M52 [Actinoplanes lobatus]GIE40800.1 peptidase M52 [Actinoplanes lobatus]